jgi:hypothetical protein
MTFTFLKPVKANQALRLLLANVANYRAGRISVGAFELRARRLWKATDRMGFAPQVSAAYLAKMEGTKGTK